MPSTEVEFLREVLRRDALAEAAQDQDQTSRWEPHALERRAREHVEDLATGAAAVVHDGFTMSIMRGLIGGEFVALRAAQPLRVEHRQQQLVAGRLVEQVVDR